MVDFEKLCTLDFDDHEFWKILDEWADIEARIDKKGIKAVDELGQLVPDEEFRKIWNDTSIKFRRKFKGKEGPEAFEEMLDEIIKKLENEIKEKREAGE